MNNKREQYPVGQIYKIRKGGLFKVVEHGFLSVCIEVVKHPSPDGWVGINEMCDWLKTGQIEPVRKRPWWKIL